MSKEEEFVEESVEEEDGDKESRDFTLSFISADKWAKNQTISFLDFSSLDGTISTVFKILAVVFFVLWIKGKKNK